MENQEHARAMLNKLGKNLVAIGGLYVVYFRIFMRHIKSGRANTQLQVTRTKLKVADFGVSVFMKKTCRSLRDGSVEISLRGTQAIAPPKE